MARKWEITTNQFAWNFEECEETVLIAAYEEIKGQIPSGQAWAVEFENHFYQHGNGVAYRYIDEINAVRRRAVLSKIEFQETDVYEYGRSSNKLMKSERRQRVRDELAAMPTDQRARLLEHARAEVARLPPPHIPYEVYKANKKRLAEEADASREEVGRRMRAFQTDAGRPKVNLDVEKALKMLSLVSDPNLRLEIIDRLSSDDALEAASRVEDAELRDALVRHSLTALARAAAA